MNHTPQQQNKYVTAIVVSLIVFGLGVYMLPNVVRVRPLFCQLTALVTVIAAVFLLTRYKTTSFTYSIRPRSKMHEDTDMEAALAGGYIPVTKLQPKYLDFTVSKKQGSRDPAMECVMGLDSLVSAIDICASKPDARFRKCSDAISYAREKYGTVTLYDYTVTLGVDRSLLLLFREGETVAAIRIEPSSEMRDYLVSLVKE